MACVQEEERSRKRKNPAKVRAGFKKWRDARRGHALVSVARNRAKKRGLPFDLSAEDIQARVEAGRCELTGIPFDLTVPWAWNSPSLDQMVPGKGYTQENVRVVLFALNVMANTWGPEKIMVIAAAISQRRREQSDALSMRIGERLQENLAGRGSTLFAMTWSRSATPSGRPYYRLRASAHRTSGSGSTSWQSPRATDGSNGGPNQSGGALSHDASLAPWPTPQTADTTGGGQEKRVEGRSNLNDFALLAPWPTPTTSDDPQDMEKRAERGAKWGFGPALTLGTAARTATWSTPSARDWKDTPGMAQEAFDTRGRYRDRIDQLPRQAMHLVSGPEPSGSPVGTEKRGSLNPAFSRWLMGYPPEWDACAGTGTRWSRRSRRSS